MFLKEFQPLFPVDLTLSQNRCETTKNQGFFLIKTTQFYPRFQPECYYLKLIANRQISVTLNQGPFPLLYLHANAENPPVSFFKSGIQPGYA